MLEAASAERLEKALVCHENETQRICNAFVRYKNACDCITIGTGLLLLCKVGISLKSLRKPSAALMRKKFR
jgi:hypothetical protein